MLLRKFYILLFLCCWTGWVTANEDGEEAVRPRVGLVLSGGGAKGMAHVGALKVIEELGIPIDYIAGTSMGSIVGGLYALGYTSTQLENYMKEADWESLLTDRVLRQHVSIFEKGQRKRYWLQIPVVGGKIDLPLGILSGQNVSNLFCELASPAYNQSDFSQFAIPFLCVATDIRTGAEVVLKHGNLAKSMRASMAIPTVFTPEVIDGQQLFDGGLTNNFPANLLRDKGIDILIGVDVTSQNEIPELNNIYKVMEQVVFMSSQPLKEANRKLCRVLIAPELSGYSTSSFNAVDSLIIRGERAARLHYNELKALADSLRHFKSEKNHHQTVGTQPLSSFYVQKVVINGLKNTSREFLLQKMDLDYPAEMTFDQLNKALEKVKGTQVYQSIVYQLNPLPDKTIELQLDCMEQSDNMIKVGLHYDNEYKAALLLKLSLKNFLLNDSKAGVELSVGANPAFSLTYFQSPKFHHAGEKIHKSHLSPDWMFQVDGYRFDAYNYLDNKRISAYTFNSFSSGAYLLLTPSLHSAIGAGIAGEYSAIRTKVGKEIEDKQSDHLNMTCRLFYECDTYNEDYFPTKGYKIHIEGNFNKGLSKDVRYSEGFFGLLFRSNFASTPADRWTLYSGVDIGAVFGGSILPQYQMRLGGDPDKHLPHQINFTGMYFLQQYDKTVMVVHLNNQIRFWNNIYVTFRANIGKLENAPVDLIVPEKIKIGSGVSVQYNMMVGPVGFTLSSSNVTKSLLGAFHLGFWF